MLDIVDTEGRREPGKVDLKMGGFDLIWDGGPVTRFDRPTSLPTMLGCYNDRDKNQASRGGILQLAGVRAPLTHVHLSHVCIQSLLTCAAR